MHPTLSAMEFRQFFCHFFFIYTKHSYLTCMYCAFDTCHGWQDLMLKIRFTGSFAGTVHGQSVRCVPWVVITTGTFTFLFLKLITLVLVWKPANFRRCDSPQGPVPVRKDCRQMAQQPPWLSVCVLWTMLSWPSCVKITSTRASSMPHVKTVRRLQWLSRDHHILTTNFSLFFSLAIQHLMTMLIVPFEKVNFFLRNVMTGIPREETAYRRGRWPLTRRSNLISAWTFYQTECQHLGNICINDRVWTASKISDLGTLS